MIKIGDFARLGQVSVATLRHYDEIGLLKRPRDRGDIEHHTIELFETALYHRASEIAAPRQPHHDETLARRNLIDEFEYDVDQIVMVSQ